MQLHIGCFLVFLNVKEYRVLLNNKPFSNLSILRADIECFQRYLISLVNTIADLRGTNTLKVSVVYGFSNVITISEKRLTETNNSSNGA